MNEGGDRAMSAAAQEVAWEVWHNPDGQVAQIVRKAIEVVQDFQRMQAETREAGA